MSPTDRPRCATCLAELEPRSPGSRPLASHLQAICAKCEEGPRCVACGLGAHALVHREIASAFGEGQAHAFRAPPATSGVAIQFVSILLELSEEQRQLVLLALATLALRSPGFDHALNEIAKLLDNTSDGRASMYDRFRAMGPGRGLEGELAWGHSFAVQAIVKAARRYRLARAALGWIRELERLQAHELAEWEELVKANEELVQAVELELIEGARADIAAGVAAKS